MQTFQNLIKKGKYQFWVCKIKKKAILHSCSTISLQKYAKSGLKEDLGSVQIHSSYLTLNLNHKFRSDFFFSYILFVLCDFILLFYATYICPMSSFSMYKLYVLFFCLYPTVLENCKIQHWFNIMGYANRYINKSNK